MGTPPAEAAGEPPAAPAEDKPGPEAGPRSREASQQPQQGSREASQQPQAAGGALLQQPASSSQLAGGSKLSAGSGGSLKRPRGSGGAKGGEESKVVVYGKEVVGRQVGVWSAKAADWPKAVVAQYNGAAGQHLLRYLERPAGSIKHHEEWVCLSRTRFQWLAAPPPQAKPNPSWDGAPRGDEAVGYKVRLLLWLLLQLAWLVLLVLWSCARLGLLLVGLLARSVTGAAAAGGGSDAATTAAAAVHS